MTKRCRAPLANSLPSTQRRTSFTTAHKWADTVFSSSQLQPWIAEWGHVSRDYDRVVTRLTFGPCEAPPRSIDSVQQAACFPCLHLPSKQARTATPPGDEICEAGPGPEDKGASAIPGSAGRELVMSYDFGSKTFIP